MIPIEWNFIEEATPWAGQTVEILVWRSATYWGNNAHGVQIWSFTGEPETIVFWRLIPGADVKKHVGIQSRKPDKK